MKETDGNVADYLSKVRKLGRRSCKRSFMAGGPSPEDLMYKLVKLGALKDGSEPLHSKTRLSPDCVECRFCASCATPHDWQGLQKGGIGEQPPMLLSLDWPLSE